MREFFSKFGNSSVSEASLVSATEIKAFSKPIRSMPLVKSVKVSDDTTLKIELKKEFNGSCILKNVGNGRVILSVFWEIPKKGHLTYSIGSMLWNDNKRSSHTTCAYITHKNLCTMESHLNLEWGVTTKYLDKWLENYFSSIESFQEHLKTTDEYIKKLPKNQLTALEKLEAGARLVEAVAAVFYAFD